MSFLERIGLGQKRKEMAPLIGDKKKKEQEKRSLRYNPYVRGFIFIAFIAASVFSLPTNTINTGFNYSSGQPWRSGDLTAPFDFAINKTEDELATEREEIQESIAPIYRVDRSVALSIQSRLDSLYRELQPVLDTYQNWQDAKRENLVSANDDSIRFIQEVNRSALNLTETSLVTLLESYD